MSIRIVHRPARTTPALRPLPEISLENPPTLAEGSDGAGAAALRILPLLGAGCSMTVMMLFRHSSFAAIGALMMIITVLASAIMMLSQRGKAARSRREARDIYLEYLENQRDKMRSAEAKQLADAHRIHPAPDELLSIAMSPDRLWERRRGDSDFLTVRLGVGTVPSREIKVKTDDNVRTRSDPFMASEVELVKSRFCSTPGMPMLVALDSIGAVSVVGSRAFVTRMARLIATQAAVFHSPEDLQLALVVDDNCRSEWDWFSWLPQLASQTIPGPFGPGRVIVPSIARLRSVLGPELDSRSPSAAEARRALLTNTEVQHSRILVLVDQYGQSATTLTPSDPQIKLSQVSTTVVYLLHDRRAEPGAITTRISEGQKPGSFVVENYPRPDAAPRVVAGELDDLDPGSTTALARVLSPLRLSPDSQEHDATQEAMTFAELLGVPDYNNVDFSRAWAPRGETGFLRVAIGTDDMGEPVTLDLKEAAQYGMGPHGLCVGATGSGKSEMLRTLVLGLLVSHDPEDLAMVLVDYKGGATFAPFDGAPQVSGIITNLSDDASLIERVYASLSGEVQRRQQVLRDAGNIADITTYRALRAERPELGLAPFPHLLVIIDEFGELLTARPDFIELFLSIGRIGRSIGVHLMLSSQRIEGGKLRGLDTYLSYRIGLRTLSESESRTILETTDAFHLPPIPGYGYLKVDTTTYTRFRAGFVSGPLPEDPEHEQKVEAPPVVLPVPSYLVTRSEAGEDTPAATRVSTKTTGPTVLSTVMNQLRQQKRVTQPIWLPPLPEATTLDTVAGEPRPTNSGLRIHSSALLRFPVGIIDDPARQWQDTWELDLLASGGHIQITGGPGSGKTTLLRTITASLALTHSPSLVSVYVLDLLGSALLSLRDLVNVGGVAVRADREVVRRTLEEVRGLLNQRELLLQQHRADSLASLRTTLEDPSVNLAEIVLLVDGYGQLAEEFDDLAEIVFDLLRRGAAHGIHIVATTTRWNEIRMAQQSFFGNKIELRLSDPLESTHGRNLAETLPSDRPGRALLAGGLFAHVALPRVDGVASDDDAAEGLRRLSEAVSAGVAERAAEVRLLPPDLSPEGVKLPRGKALVALGLDESDLSTTVLDMDGTDRHLIVLGDSGTGRTTMLRRVIAELVRTHGPDELVFAVFDPRRSLSGVVPEGGYLGGTATSAVLAQKLVAAIVPELEARVPRSVDASVEVAPPTPHIVILIDDYDALGSGAGPFQALMPFIPMGNEIGLSVVLTRRMTGAGRAMYDPLVNTMRDSGATGFMLSGDRSEGMLLGNQRPRTLPIGRTMLLRSGQPVRTVQIVNQPDQVTETGES